VYYGLLAAVGDTQQRTDDGFEFDVACATDAAIQFAQKRSSMSKQR
jgi:hypothetical protein